MGIKSWVNFSCRKPEWNPALSHHSQLSKPLSYPACFNATGLEVYQIKNAGITFRRNSVAWGKNRTWVSCLKVSLDIGLQSYISTSIMRRSENEKKKSFSCLNQELNTALLHPMPQVNPTSYPVCCTMASIEVHK